MHLHKKTKKLKSLSYKGFQLFFTEIILVMFSSEGNRRNFP